MYRDFVLFVWGIVQGFFQRFVPKCTLVVWTVFMVLSLFPLEAAQAFVRKSIKNSEFVEVRHGRFSIQGKPFHFIGTNLWYGINLGAAGSKGQRARLLRELDRLQAMGVTNLRIMAASEGPDSEPWRMSPALQQRPGSLDQDLLLGLDFLLAEMKKRGLYAVVCLNNFWPWSGGMSQYLQWSKGGRIPYPPPQPGGSWETYQTYTSVFYSDERAMSWFRNFIQNLVQRKNHITGERYLNDPTIMAWQLANEPRGMKNAEAFNAWIEKTASFIKALDARHLVTVGTEGETPFGEDAGMNFVRNHSSKWIDYTTAHIWAQNWGWYDPQKATETFSSAVQKMKSYLYDHAEKARRLGKPLVIEEFGFSRDQNDHTPAKSTSYRDRYYFELMNEVFKIAQSGGSVQGANFWAWSGEGFPQKPYGGYWKPGMPFTGDPPHETQGWYSVYHTDQSTIRIITDFARKMNSLNH